METIARPTLSRKTALPDDDPCGVRRGGLHEEAASRLRRMIFAGELKPAQPLREVVFSDLFEMSRTPVREAFRTLAAEGLVELLPNRSVIVSEVDRNASVDVFFLLAAMESLAARQACERMSAIELRALVDMQGEMIRCFEASDRVGYMATNQRAHELIMAAARNVSLMNIWRLTLPRAMRARSLNNLDRGRWAEALAEHGLICDALAARDADVVGRLMAEHFKHGVDQIRADGAPASARTEAG